MYKQKYLKYKIKYSNLNLYKKKSLEKNIIKEKNNNLILNSNNNLPNCIKIENLFNINIFNKLFDDIKTIKYPFIQDDYELRSSLNYKNEIYKSYDELSNKELENLKYYQKIIFPCIIGYTGLSYKNSNIITELMEKNNIREIDNKNIMQDIFNDSNNIILYDDICVPPQCTPRLCVFYILNKIEKSIKLIITIRGTKKFDDIITDINIFKNDFNLFTTDELINLYKNEDLYKKKDSKDILNPQVHEGFNIFYNKIITVLSTKILEETNLLNKFYDLSVTDIIICGHSMGSVLSQLFTLELRKIYSNEYSNQVINNNISKVYIHLFSFGTPRVFSINSSKLLYNKKLKIDSFFNIYNSSDIIHNIPKYFDWSHIIEPHLQLPNSKINYSNFNYHEIDTNKSTKYYLKKYEEKSWYEYFISKTKKIHKFYIFMDKSEINNRDINII